MSKSDSSDSSFETELMDLFPDLVAEGALETQEIGQVQDTESAVGEHWLSRKRNHPPDEVSNIEESDQPIEKIQNLSSDPTEVSNTEESDQPIEKIQNLSSDPTEVSNIEESDQPIEKIQNLSNDPTEVSNIEESDQPIDEIQKLSSDPTIIPGINKPEPQPSTSYSSVLIRRLPTKYIITQSGECRVRGHEAGPSTLLDDTVEYGIFPDDETTGGLSSSISLGTYQLLELICDTTLMRNIDRTVLHNNIPVIIDTDGLGHYPTNITSSGLAFVNRATPSVTDVQNFMPFAIQNVEGTSSSTDKLYGDTILRFNIIHLICIMEAFFDLFESVIETIIDSEIKLRESETSTTYIPHEDIENNTRLRYIAICSAMIVATASDCLRNKLPIKLVGTALMEKMAICVSNGISWQQLTSENLIKMNEVLKVAQSKFLLNLALVLIQDAQTEKNMEHYKVIIRHVFSKYSNIYNCIKIVKYIIDCYKNQ